MDFVSKNGITSEVAYPYKAVTGTCKYNNATMKTLVTVDGY
jgi:hypothetical protein